MASQGVLQGEPLLAALSEAMVAMHERYYGREPATAKSLMMGDDLLACVLGGVYTDVEKTLIRSSKRPRFRRPAAPFRRRCNGNSSRSSSGSAAAGCWRLSPTNIVGPDLEIELFVLSREDNEPTSGVRVDAGWPGR